MRKLVWAGSLIFALTTVACSSGKTCGAGTTAKGGNCVPASTVSCATGTSLQNGKCVPASTACGAGTTLDNGQCVPASGACGAGTTLQNGACVPSNPLTCGSGTWPYNGQCVPYNPNDTTPPVTTATPAGGSFRALPQVTLSTNEPATIYYTTDGTTPDTSSSSEPSPVLIADVTDGMQIQFFAVDPAGNTETVQSETYNLDVTPPGVATNVVATLNGADIDVAWTNPTASDFAGVLLTTPGDPTQGPVDGTAYNVGASLPNGATILYEGTGTTFTDAAAAAGAHRYQVFTFDNLNNYSAAVTSNLVNVSLPSQDVTLSVDRTTDVVTVTTPPPSYTVTSTGTATFNSTGYPPTVTVHLDISNPPRLIYNLKAIFASSAVAAIGSYQVPPSTAQWYLPITPVLAPGGDVTIDMQIKDPNSTSTSPFTATFTLRDDPMLYTGAASGGAGFMLQRIDSGMARLVNATACDQFFHSGGDCASPGGWLDPGGRFVFLGHRNMPIVRKYDPVTDTTVQWTVLTNNQYDRDSTEGIVGSPDGQYLYVILNQGGPSYATGDYSSGPMDIYLVKLSYATMQELARVQLASAANPNIRAHPFAITADGTRAYVPMENEGTVRVVDLTTMTEVDTDPTTAGVQPIDVSSIGTVPWTVLLSPDESKLYVGFSGPNGLAVVDLSTYAVSAVSTTKTGFVVNQMTVDNTGRLWVAADTSGLLIYDPTTPTETWLGGSGGATPPAQPVTVTILNGGLTAAVGSGNSVWYVSTGTTPSVIDADGNAVNGLTGITLNGTPGDQFMRETPY